MRRTVKSFVLRNGRMSTRQQHALDNWLDDYIIHERSSAWSLASLFGREAATVVEIGFGMGASLVEMARLQPEINFIGIEVHRAGIGSIIADLHENKISNVKVAPYDAVEVFSQCLINDSLAGVQIFFPDPWPKKKHHKRRLIQADFVHLLSQKIKPGGFLHCATDWQDYAEHMLSVLSAEPTLVNQSGEGFASRPQTRPLTKFEKRGQRLGHGVWDLIFIRQ